jgi:hypothetical protein
MSDWYSTHTRVWTHTVLGETLIADCTNKNLPTSDQRLNARICAAAPELLELLEDAYLSMEPEYQVRYLTISAWINNAKGKDGQV